MNLLGKRILGFTALAILLSSSIASAEFATRLSAGKTFSVSASQCRLSVVKEGNSQVSIRCSQRGSVPRRASNIELKFGQVALIEAKACNLKVISRSSALVKVACNAGGITPQVQSTPTPTPTTQLFTSSGMFDGKCYLKGQDTGEVVNGAGYCSANGLTYVGGNPANGLVSGVLYQQGLTYTGIYQGGLYSNGIKLTSSGSLDKETFQGTGFVSSNAGLSGYDSPYERPSTEPIKVLIQTDSKIVVVGLTWFQEEIVNSVIIRYLSDGTLDASFGTGGAIVLPYEELITSAFQFGEKLLLGTSSHILRLNSDGSFDVTFGQGGKASLDNVGSFQRFMALQPDGRMVVIGRKWVPMNPGLPIVDPELPIVVGRLNTDGSLDTSFGTAGLVTINDSPDMHGVRLATQPDGGIIISSSDYITGQGFDSGLYRLNSNGSIDTSFGDQGKAVLPNTAGIRQIATQSDGGILVATGSYGRTIYRVKPSGILDTDFGVGGVAVVPGLPGERYSGVGIGTLQLDGKIILGGASEALTDKGGVKSVGLLVRLTATGSVDTSFGTNGVKGYTFANSNYNGIMGLAVQSDGRLVGAASAVDVDGRSKIFTFRLWS